MEQGKEAAAVRKAILVVMLVAASFLGGVFVNGPGLQWIEARALRSLGLHNGGEIALVDLKPAASSEMTVDELKLAAQGNNSSEGPQAPIPALLTEPELAQHDSSDRPSTFQAAPKSNSIGSDLPKLRSPQASPSPTKRPIALARALAHSAQAADPDVKQASTTSRSGDSGGSERSDTNAKPDILDTLAALLPSSSESSTAQLPSPASRPPSSTQKPVVNGSDDWAVIERKMQSLGVSRYTIDGEPGVRVMFSCLIPLAGRQAIMQRFEAEGDDVVEAAQATLRRITLWRATQPSSR
jgi:hypothetical protein